MTCSDPYVRTLLYLIFITTLQGNKRLETFPHLPQITQVVISWKVPTVWQWKISGLKSKVPIVEEDWKLVNHILWGDMRRKG